MLSKFSDLNSKWVMIQSSPLFKTRSR